VEGVAEEEFVLVPWLEDTAPLLLVEHRQFENPEKKHTEHWIEMAPSDFRSKVADWSDTIMSSPDGGVTLINTRRHHNQAAPWSPQHQVDFSSVISISSQ